MTQEMRRIKLKEMEDLDSVIEGLELLLDFKRESKRALARELGLFVVDFDETLIDSILLENGIENHLKPLPTL